jgi:cation-transporting ATPase E
LTGAGFSQFFFVFFYIANISIGIIQEIRAKKCIDKLSIVANNATKVIRDGKTIEISPSEIVLDDIVLLGMGNQIPTDCEIVVGEVEVNESLLTGESVPIKKKIGDTLLAGSFIVSGTCTAQAMRVGSDNYVETLSAKAKQYKKPNSEIMNSLKRIIKIISFIIVPIAAAFMIKSTLIIQTDLPSAVLGAATVVIGMIPAGMFLLTSVALAVGIIKLARHNTLVQDLYSLEMLARVDTICFDKTGTITDGKMTVSEVVSVGKTEFDVNSIMSSMLFALKDINQTALALKDFFGEECKFEHSIKMPFNSARKLSAVTFNDEIGTFAFGAPEFVLSKEEYSKLEKLITEYAMKGLRVLVLAHSNNKIVENNAPNDFSPISLILIVDNVREDAIETIKWFKENNVAIKVISGDNPVTVAEVSRRVGIENADKYISLEGMSEEEVFAIANEYTVFGRVSPEQKAILVKALKSAGHVTAMTGDGVNDILALKESDCAISVASGSDSARSISHLVLLDNNFASMPKVVYEGRRVINNVQCSSSLFLMKTLFTMIMSIITLCLPYMQTYPFVASQMIILEVFVIGLPAFALSLQPNKERVSGRFINYVIKKSLPGALTMVFSVVLIEIIKKTLGYFSDEIYTTLQVYAIFLSGLVNLLFVCRPFTKYRTILLVLTSIIVIGIILFTIFVGFPFINFYPMLPFGNYWHHLLIVLGTTILCFPLSILFQLLFNKVIK